MLFLHRFVKHPPPPRDINNLLSSPSSRHSPANNLHVYPGSNSPWLWRKTLPLLKTNRYKDFWRKRWHSLLQNHIVIWGAWKHKERKGERLPGLLLTMEAAASAAPRSCFWEERQKGIFVLIKAKHNKTGLTRLAKISFPSQIAKYGSEFFTENIVQKTSLCWLFSLTWWREPGAQKPKQNSHCPQRAGICFHGSISYPDTQ